MQNSDPDHCFCHQRLENCRTALPIHLLIVSVLSRKCILWTRLPLCSCSPHNAQHSASIFIYLYPCHTSCPKFYTCFFLSDISIFFFFIIATSLVQALTMFAPWIQPAMDCDSSAREAVLRKRRERDRDHHACESCEERGSTL